MCNRKYVSFADVKSIYVSVEFPSLSVEVIVDRHYPKKGRRLFVNELLFEWIHAGSCRVQQTTLLQRQAVGEGGGTL
jgi:hypothetical protein